MSPHVNLWGLALTRQSLVSDRRFRPLFTAAHITLTRSQMMALVPNYFAETYITATAIVSAVVYVLYIIVMKVLAYQSAPIRDLPSPKLVNWLTGSHARNVWESDAQGAQLEWIREYGPVFRHMPGSMQASFRITKDKTGSSCFADEQDYHDGSTRVKSRLRFKYMLSKT